MRKGEQLVICPQCGNAFPIEKIVDHVSKHSDAVQMQVGPEAAPAGG